MSKILLAVLSFCWFPYLLKGQPVRNSLLSGELVSQHIVDTIPISVEHNLIFLTVYIDQKPRKFLLDTGAPTTLSASLQHELKYDTLFKGTLIDVHGTSDSASFVKVTAFSVGKLEFRNVPSAVLNLRNSFLGCFGIDGIIGGNTLQHLVCKFDIRSRQIIFSDGPSITPASKPIPITLDNQSSPYLKINPGPRANEELLFDTGYTGLYSLCNRNYQFFISRRRLKNTELAKGKGNSTFGLYGSGTPTQLYLLKLRYIKVNNGRITKPIISTSSDRNSKLGAELFTYGTVTIDYRHKAFWFQPYQQKVNAANPGTWGIEPTSINGRICVGVVWSGTPAEKAGLSYGQPILKVNGFQLSDVTLCNMFTISWEIQSELTLEVEVDDEIRSIKLTKAFYK
ncbi:MAG: aspartyl protease family protein [Cyclobacteriaceae bacterium]